MLRNIHEGQQFDVSLKRQIISDGPKVKYNTGVCVTSCISGAPSADAGFLTCDVPAASVRVFSSRKLHSSRKHLPSAPPLMTILAIG